MRAGDVHVRHGKRSTRQHVSIGHLTSGKHRLIGIQRFGLAVDDPAAAATAHTDPTSEGPVNAGVQSRGKQGLLGSARKLGLLPVYDDAHGSLPGYSRCSLNAQAKTAKMFKPALYTTPITA